MGTLHDENLKILQRSIGTTRKPTLLSTIKRAGPSFGHVDVDYQLQPIFDRAVKSFEEADTEDSTLEKQWKATKDHKLYGPMFQASIRRREAGVILLITAGAFLEQCLYNYATTFLDAEWYGRRIDRRRTVEKWRLLPRVCQKKRIGSGHPAIHALQEFVAVRNAVVHPKRKIMGRDPIRVIHRSKTEPARFISACRKAQETVRALIQLLECPPSALQ